jgi:hypothetical protein
MVRPLLLSWIEEWNLRLRFRVYATYEVVSPFIAATAGESKVVQIVTAVE